MQHAPPHMKESLERPMYSATTGRGAVGSRPERAQARIDDSGLLVPAWYWAGTGGTRMEKKSAHDLDRKSCGAYFTALKK